MSWLYSRALVAEYSAATSSVGARSALSSATPTPQAFLPPDRMTAFSRPSRSGMTFAPLTADLGEALLMWFLADSRVRTYRLPVEAPASMGSDPGCGPSSHGSLARYDPTASSWKTAQLSLLEGSDEFSETWPSWGMTRNGECWERMTWAPRIGAKESGSRPAYGTTTAGGRYIHAPAAGIRSITNCSAGMDAPTARATTYPTPTATMHKGWSPGHNRAGSDDRLDYTIERMNFQPGQTTPPKRLNPEWVEWLMGWPQGWSALKPLETHKFHEWQRQHSPTFRDDEEDAA